MGVRRYWTINPRERVREDKDIDDEKKGYCLGCFQVYTLCLCPFDEQ